MRGIAIPKRINYIFQKKSLIIFYFLSILFFIFLKKKKIPLKGGVGVGGHPLVFNFFFYKKKKLII
jgi:hypothetical protein